MGYINLNLPPLYNYNEQRPQKSPVESFLGVIEGVRKQREQNNRARMQEYQKKLENNKPSELITQSNQEQGLKFQNDLYELITDAMMYKMDDDGTFTSKRKEIPFLGGPQIDDREALMIRKAFSDYDDIMTNAIAGEAKYKAAEKALEAERLNPKGNIDTNLTQKRMQLYYDEGIETPDGFIVPAFEDPDVWATNDKYRTKLQNTPNAVGDYNVYLGAPRNVQTGFYNMEMQGLGKQMGMARKMIGEIRAGTDLGKKGLERLMGENPNITLEDIAKMDDRLNNWGELNPVLANAAIIWGEQDYDTPSKIAGEIRVRSPRAESKKTTTEETLPEGRSINMAGYKSNNAIHIGEKQYGLSIPQGSIMYTTGGGQSEYIGDKPIDAVVNDYDAENNKILFSPIEVFDTREGKFIDPATIMTDGYPRKYKEEPNYDKVIAVDGSKIDAVGLSISNKKLIRNWTKGRTTTENWTGWPGEGTTQKQTNLSGSYQGIKTGALKKGVDIKIGEIKDKITGKPAIEVGGAYPLKEGESKVLNIEQNGRIFKAKVTRGTGGNSEMLTIGSASNKQSNEVVRVTKDGRKAIYNADTHEFIRWQ